MSRLPRKRGKNDFVKTMFCKFLLNFNVHFCLYLFRRLLLVPINHIHLYSPKSKYLHICHDDQVDFYISNLICKNVFLFKTRFLLNLHVFCEHEKLLHISFIKNIIAEQIKCMLDYSSYMHKAIKLNFLSSVTARL